LKEKVRLISAETAFFSKIKSFAVFFDFREKKMLSDIEPLNPSINQYKD
jgi:hypothetical protein